MTVPLDKIVPWGRSCDEYRRMFDLTDHDLDQSILGCGDGPASFNAELAAQGKRVISVDPIYCHTAAEIERRIGEVWETMLTTTRRHAAAFLWDEFETPERQAEIRRETMGVFLDNFAQTAEGTRYVAGALPHLPFRNDAFDLALCSHYLFTYTDLLDESAHLQAILEMLRVAQTVRVFPLLAMFDGGKSRHLDGVTSALRGTGSTVRVRRVAYEFQRGGNEMLEIRGEQST